MNPRIAGITLVIVALVTGCAGTPSPAPITSGAPQSTDTTASATSGSSEPPDSPSAPEPTLPPAFQGIIPDDIFTRQPDPLNLTVTTDAGAATTVAIGSDGGEISAKGPDGTDYKLTIPAGDLGLTTDITMAPIASVAGIPDEAGAKKTYGVVFQPNGLLLVKPATLTITPVDPIGTQTAAMLTFEGSGAEAGFHVFDQSATGVTTQVDHFSGITFSSPFTIDAIPPSLRIRFFSEAEAEARLFSEIAALLGLIRQQQMLGVQPFSTPAEIAHSALGAFHRLVLSPRVAVADRSCWDANRAMEAYIAYVRMRQLLGVGDDPAFDLVGVGGLYVPAALLDLAVSVCFKDAYLRCFKTGDFPSLVAYYVTFFERAQLLAGPTSEEHLAIAVGYLKQCGRWRLRIGTSQVADYTANLGFVYSLESTREFFLQWKPGGGEYGGIVGSTIEGSGPVDTTKLDYAYSSGCPTNAVTNIASKKDATAQIDEMSFDHYEGPTPSGDPIQPVPTSLKLSMQFGLTTYDHDCVGGPPIDFPDSQEPYTESYMLVAKTQGREFTAKDLGDALSGLASVTINTDWQFSTQPYRATIAMSDTLGPYEPEALDRLEITMEHEPL